MLLAATSSARRRPLPPQPVTIAIVNIGGKNASTDGSGGVLLHGGFSSGDTLKVYKTTGLTFQAWSYYGDDSGGGPDGSWLNEFRVTRADATQSTHWTGLHMTADEAEATAIAAPVYLTGSDRYTIWLYDTPATDNRGGLSVIVDRL